MRLLPDTHILLWALTEPARLLTVDAALGPYSELIEIL